MPKKQRKLLGRFIVADPKICHGKATFIGTRIMVWQILEQVSEGIDWDEITRQCKFGARSDAKPVLSFCGLRPRAERQAEGMD